MWLLAAVVGGLLVLAVVLAAAGVAREQRSRDPEAAGEASADHLRAYAGLCNALELVGEGEVERAGEVFADDVHGPLHVLADEVAGRVALNLLRTKERVERQIREEAPAAELEQGLADLAVVTNSAIEATGTAPPPVCRAG